MASGLLGLEEARLRLPPLTSTSSFDSDGKPIFEFKHNEGAFISFSWGPMNCVGKALALLEMRMLACAILQRFRLRLREGWDTTGRRYEDELKDYFNSTRVDLPVILERR